MGSTQICGKDTLPSTGSNVLHGVKKRVYFGVFFAVFFSKSIRMDPLMLPHA